MTGWYATQAAWWMPFEASARRRYGTDLRHEYRRPLHGGVRPSNSADHLVYTLTGLEIPGAPPTVDIVIRFWATPSYDTFGLAAQDFPRVHAEPALASPHRHRDDALCL